MIIIPNSQIREMKAEGPCSFRVAHLIIVRPSDTPSHHICCLFMNSQTFLSHTGPQSLFLSSHFFTLIKPYSPASSVLELLKYSNRELASA